MPDLPSLCKGLHCICTASSFSVQVHGLVADCLESSDRSRANERQGWQKLSICFGDHASHLPAARQLQQPTGCLCIARTAHFAAATLVLSLQRRFVRGYRHRPQQQTRSRDLTLAAARQQAPLSLPTGVAVTVPPQLPLAPWPQSQRRQPWQRRSACVTLQPRRSPPGVLLQRWHNMGTPYGCSNTVSHA